MVGLPEQFKPRRENPKNKVIVLCAWQTADQPYFDQNFQT